jgi:hypothetical protein
MLFLERSRTRRLTQAEREGRREMRPELPRQFIVRLRLVREERSMAVQILDN